MIRIDKDSYLNASTAERGAKIIKSWEVAELEVEEGIPSVDLKRFLTEHLGENHEAVSAAASFDAEHPLDEEACEALLKAFDPRAIVEAELQKAAKAAEEKRQAQNHTQVEEQEIPHEPELTEEQAQSRAETILSEAQQSAKEMLSEAEQRAKEIISEAERTFEEAKLQAAAEIAQAQLNAQSMLDNAAIKRQEVFAAAQKQGYAEGVAASRSALLKVREDYEMRLKGFFEQAQLYNDTRNTELERSVLAMSVDIAEKILGITLEKDVTPFLELISRAVEQLNAKNRFNIRLNKREYDRIMEKGDEELRRRLGDAPFSVICDGSLEPGALLLQADEGTVDAGVTTQLERTKNVFGITGETS